nr:ABC transporter substrate-binding protein [uncultured Cohaesibacter sp.]
MPFIAALIVGWMMACPSALADGRLFPALDQANKTGTLTVYSSLDTNLSMPLIEAFRVDNPDVAISYVEMLTQDVYERVTMESDRSGATADLTISSAMDLQIKLANDGYAQPVMVPEKDLWPNWASWRDTAFALTFEPAVIVYHKPTFAKVPPPHSRAELTKLLREQSDTYFGRVATYDIERAGVGYMFLAMDEKHDRNIWDLVSAMGSAGVKLYSYSSAILQRVSDGQFALGYNILGSYANKWQDAHPELGIILPTDYTLVMSRIALVPRAAREPELGKRFLTFLMSEKGQDIMSTKVRLPALHPRVNGKNTFAEMSKIHGSRLRPIAVRPSLMVYLDQVKRARIVEKWNKALKSQ